MSSISRRKLSSTEDFLKLLADGIRQEKMGLKGADKGYTLNFLEIIPQKITPVDVLSANPNTQSIGETATPSDINLSYTETATSYHIAFGNDATLFGATWTATSGKYRGGLNFDGSDDYARIIDSNSLDIANAISVEDWVNPDGFIANTPIINKNDTNGWQFYLNASGYVVFGLFSLWDTASSTSIVADTWSHVAATYDKSNVRLYINGSLDNTVAHTESIGTGTANVIIGNYATNYFDGDIDEVSVYNRALSSSEIISAYNGNISKDGLILYLSFDEGSGSTSTDLSGALMEFCEVS